MSKIIPKPGTQYTIVKGDTLWDIANICYGSGFKYTIIWNANKSHLMSKDPHWIYPGEVLWIPEEVTVNTDMSGNTPALAVTRLYPTKESPDLQLKVGDKEYGVTSGSLTATLDTIANGWTLDMPWYRQIKNQYETFKPYQYQKANFLLNGCNLTGESLIYGVNPSFSPDRKVINITGYTSTVDFLDCIAKTGKKAKNIKLSDWISELAEAFSIPVQWDSDIDPELKKVTLDKLDNVGGHIQQLANNYGITVSNTTAGGLLLHDVKAEGDIEANFDEENVIDRPIRSGEVSYDGRVMFRNYIGYGQSPRGSVMATGINESVKRNRTTGINISKADKDIAEAMIFAARDQSILAALQFKLELSYWFNDFGAFFRPGAYVTYRAPSLFIEKPMTLIVKAVEYKKSGDEKTLVLHLVRPRLYTYGKRVLL